MSDVWKYEIPNQRMDWMAGDSMPGARVLGTRGVPSTLNLPGQIGECPTPGPIPTTISGSTEAAWTSTRIMSSGASTPRPVNGPGCPRHELRNPLYGTRGVFDSQNLPGQRLRIPPDQQRRQVLAPRRRQRRTGVHRFLNDLWCYDPQTNQWAWYAGDNAISDVDHTGPLCGAGLIP